MEEAHKQECLQPFSKRYILQDILGKGGMGIVYRAMDRLVGQSVALKRVLRGQENSLRNRMMSEPATGTHLSMLVGLGQEFRILSSLHHANVISVLDYGFDAEHCPYFTMELLESPCTIIEAGKSCPLQAKVQLLVQLLRALAYLHRHGIVHRDIKPSNVLCSAGQLKLLDFGIAARAGQNTELGGTFEYLAPELLLGDPPSIASDLYSVGVVAYELFTGQLPFSRESVTRMLTSILEAEEEPTVSPDAAALLARRHTPMEAPEQKRVLAADGALLISAVGEPVAAVVRRLLARQAQDRYSDATETLKELSAAVGARVPIETGETLESSLQASRFVGRTYELTVLCQALEQANDGTGGGWLLGGESGVGKSRLLEELRTHALCRGMVVFRGQAVSSGGSSYQVFQGVLKLLCLHVELDPLEAAVLKPLVPDLATLLGRPIAEAPDLDGLATQQRLRDTIHKVCARLTTPSLIILEDLQWATAEAIALLARLISRSTLHCHLWVCSYRDDEAPQLPMALPDAKVLKLTRFDELAIKELGSSILGPSASGPELTALLHRETEGNPFFLVEVLRTLIEESGGLNEVGRQKLPSKVFSGGIRAAVDRRLARIPEPARPMLRLAAVAGRQLDLRLLSALIPEAAKWLAPCAEVAVLEMVEQRWQFSHDKLRERLLEALADEERRDLHQQVALTLERVYSDCDSHAAALAFHYSEAGLSEKAAYWSARAGELSFKKGAMQEAQAQLQKALFIYEQAACPLSLRLRLRRYLGDAFFGSGKLTECIACIREAYSLGGHPIPESKWQLAIAVARELAQQVRGNFHGPMQELNSDEKNIYLELLEFAPLGTAFFWNQQAKEGLLFLLIVTNLGEKVGFHESLCRSYESLAHIALFINQEWLHHSYINKSERALTLSTKPLTAAVSHQLRGITAIGRGQWSGGLDKLERARESFASQGFKRGELGSLLELACIQYYRGCYDLANHNADRIIEESKKDQNNQYRGWGLAVRSIICLNQGKFKNAEEYGREALESSNQAQDNLCKTTVMGILALIALRCERLTEARLFIDRILEHAVSNSFGGHGLLESYAAPAEVYLELRRRTSSTDSGFSELLTKSRQALKVLGRGASRFPIGKARYELWTGVYLWQQGSARAAQRCWQRAIDAGHRLQMPFEEGLACYQLGMALTGRDPAGRAYLRRALILFEQIAGTWHVEAARRALECEGEK